MATLDVTSFRQCQSCGLPTLAASPSLLLPVLSLKIPLLFCDLCKAELLRIDTFSGSWRELPLPTCAAHEVRHADAGQSGDATASAGATPTNRLAIEPPTIAAKGAVHGSMSISCHDCRQEAVAFQAAFVTTALNALAHWDVTGLGGRKVHAGRATAAALMTIPAVGVNVAWSVVKGVFGGLAMGAAGGAIAGGALGLDARNAVAGMGSNVKMPKRRSSKSTELAISPNSLPFPPSHTPDTPVDASATQATAAPATDAPIPAAGAETPPVPTPIGDAEAELQRIVKCKLPVQL
jgi:hypothetical protein